MIDAISVSGATAGMYYDKNNLVLKYLPNVNKINIFIGENNSGKSRLMRILLSSSAIHIMSNNCVANDRIITYKNNILRYITEINSLGGNIDVSEKILEKNDVDFFIEIREKLDVYLDENREIGNSRIRSCVSYTEDNLRNISGGLCRIDERNFQTAIVNLNPVYIPILRGIENFNIYFDISKDKEIMNSITINEKQRLSLEAYKSNANHIYMNKIQKAYGIRENLIFTAENLYEEITDKLLGDEKGRTFIKEFQNFISKQFYNNEEFTLIPQKSKGYINVKIGSQERPLHQLGDGIKQLITILYKIYEYKDEEKVFFIEEPELNLHPGFQRKLMEILQLGTFDKHQFFITTHSNHFIDSCFDYDNISIYKFENIEGANNKFRVTNSNKNDVSLLQSLGVNNSSIFMSNCTIWVEGISDKILIKKYLEKYFEKHGITKYREDINYAFVEYGGNNITHWDFEGSDSIETINSSGITNRSFIICDNDNDSKTKKTRKKKLKEIFGKNYCELSVREIENTVSKTILEKVLFGEETPRYKQEFRECEYMNKQVYMGKFIDDHYNLTKKYADSKGSGTIKEKLRFSKKVANEIECYDELSRQAINLCRKIVKFIEDSNV